MTADKHPVITHGWLRAIVFLFLFIVAMLLAASYLDKLITLIPALSDDPQTHYTIAGLLFSSILSVALVILFRTMIDRKSVWSLGLHWNKNQKHASIGFLLGIALACLCALFLYFTGSINWQDIEFDGLGLGSLMFFMLITAFAEEMVFRGYILNNLMDSINKWGALLISSAIFVLVHLNNPNIILPSMINLMAGGMLLGLNYVYTRNLWFSVFLHFTWNFFQGPVLGFPVSGIEFESLLQIQVQGDQIITGGEFGLEGSLLSAAILLICWIALFFTYQHRKADLEGSRES